MKRSFLIFFSLLLFALTAHAQRVIKGTITDKKGDPVIGANVVAKGTTVGTVTDIDGRYMLSVPEGTTALVVSYTGYTNQELALGASNIADGSLEEGILLAETVVTALGVSREKKTLGYATSSVSDKTITETRNSNVLDALAGRVPGVTIQTNSGSPGASSSIIVRGYASVTGRTEPLMVVDGVPVNNRTTNSIGNLNNPGDDFNRSADYGNQLGDLNPNDIESISVLRGSAATAIYGSRGAAGVILITTKSGKTAVDKFEVDYSGSFSTGQALRVPHLQNTYGQGWSGLFAFEENGSWGPRADGRLRLWGNVVDNSQLLKPFSVVENNLRDFLEPASTIDHSIGISGNTGIYHYRFGYSYLNSDGIIPSDKDKLLRNSFSFNGGAKLKKFTVSSGINFTVKDLDAVVTGQGDDAGAGKVVWQEIIQVPRDHAILDYRDYNNKFYNLDNFHTLYAQNPYFILGETGNTFKENRLLGNILFGYQITDKLGINWRLGGDYSNGTIFEYGNVARITPGSPNSAANDVVGKVAEGNISNTQINSDLFLNYNTDISNDFDLALVLGHNANHRDSRFFSTEVTNLSIPGFYSLTNTTTQPITNTVYSKRRLIGVYGQATLGFKKWLYLGVQGRNDWSSTLPKGNNSYFYPGVTLSAIVSEALSLPNFINYLKLRAGYAFTGNDADPYRIYPIYAAAQARAGGFGNINFPIGGVNSFELGDRLGNSSLKPELTSELEFGLETKLFSNRIGLDFSWYDKITKDQIISADVDPTSGYRTGIVNLGKISNKGIEFVLDLVPVRTKNFEWAVSWNYSNNKNEVLELGNSKETSILLNDAYNTELRAEVGKPVGTIYTPDFKRDPNGNIIVNPATGLPLQSDEKVYRGNINPDYITGFGTSFRFKNLTLSANADYRHGGLFYSYTARLNYFVGNAFTSTYNDRQPWIIPGSVVENGDGTYSENTTPISRSDVFTYYGATPAYEYNHVLPKTFFKLRNVALTWSPSKACLKGTGLNLSSISIWGRNLLLWTPSENHFVDPESNTFGTSLASQLGEFSTPPSTYSYGLTINLKY
ncbi:MAG TPA: SusC/RagA family TonB-linked outer membrane protein [Saprospiraceae bacterium]|nr:SusC/RagA family TonB-linked outer membrane protein [Saprospiraceae bacterium]